jgi:nucleoside-diphosphate-sugar epimerase
MAGQGRILVTGATGFIGRRLVNRLEEIGHVVYPFSRTLGHDVNDYSSFTPFLREGIEIVVHLAGLTFVPDSWVDSAAFYRVNTHGTQKVLDFCNSAKARMLYVSAYVYGVPDYLPIDESHPVRPNNPYAHSKWLGEEMCRFYSGYKGVRATILRPFNLYGPDQDERFLIPSMLRQLKEKGVIRVKDLTPRRDYLHLDDFAEALLLAMAHDEPFALFNVGSGRSYSVHQILEMLVSGGKQVPFASTDEPRENEIPETVADITAVRERLGWTPKRELRDELAGMVRADQSSFENVKGKG